MPGAGKLFRFAPPVIIAELGKVDLVEGIRPIRFGAVETAKFLADPITSSIGLLLASSDSALLRFEHPGEGKRRDLRRIGKS